MRRRPIVATTAVSAFTQTAARRLLAAVFPSVPRPLTSRVARLRGEAQHQQQRGTLPGSGANGGHVAPLPGPPPAEDLRNWRAHPAYRHEFTDVYLADLLDTWTREDA